jgi:ABC-type molybdate transport system permease subunit
MPLAIYTAVQTGESGEAFVLVAVLTLVSCAVIWLATRRPSAAQ